MQIKTRDIPAETNTEIVQPKKGEAPQAEFLVNTSYEALTRLESLVSKGNRRSILAIGISLGIGGVMIAMMMANLGKSSQSFIARSNGQTETLEFYSGTDRSDLLIQGFAGRFVQNLYTWRSTLPEPGNPLDKGIDENGKALPSSVHKATMAMEPKFATTFRKGMAELISSNLKDTDFQSVYIPSIVESPEKVGSGSWKIKVVGHQQNVGKEGPKTKLIAIQLTVRAVPPPTLKASDKQYKSSLAVASAIARAEGLEVTNLVNIKE